MTRLLAIPLALFGFLLQPATAHPPGPAARCGSSGGAPVAMHFSVQDQKRNLVRWRADQLQQIHRDYSDQMRMLNRMRSAAIRCSDPHRRQRLAEIDRQKREAAHIRRQRLADVHYVYQRQMERWRFAKQVAGRSGQFPY